ncbi:MAG: hypothetical protein P4L56_08705 [Candidatus Sulfopaludibacter sp.]|nr:hypothetical protein [Candidatus Sulfopaludibacter sp.]
MVAAKWEAAVLAIAIAGAGIAALALVFGLLYEQTQRARDRGRYPQVGRSIVILESGANWALSPAVHDPKTMFSNGGPRPGYSWVSIQRAGNRYYRVLV